MADIATYLSGNQSTTETRDPYGSQYGGLPPVNTGNLAELLRLVVGAKRAKEDRARQDAMRMMRQQEPDRQYSTPNEKPEVPLENQVPLGGFLQPFGTANSQGIGHVIDRTKITPAFLRAYGDKFGGYF